MLFVYLLRSFWCSRRYTALLYPHFLLMTFAQVELYPLFSLSDTASPTFHLSP